MFDHIILRRAVDGTPYSAGRIAEALLYYKKTHLFIDPPTLSNLIQQIGVQDILALLHRSNEVSAVYCEEIYGTHTNPVGVTEFHNYVGLIRIGHEKVGTFKTPEERICYIAVKQGVPEQKAKRFAKEFLKIVPIRKLSGNHFYKGNVLKDTQHKLLNKDLIAQYIRSVLSVTLGGSAVGEDFKFDVLDSKQGIVVFSNIDFESINRRRALLEPPIEPLTIAGLLSEILNAHLDLVLASHYGGDFVTSSAASSIIQVQYAELFKRRELNTDSLADFSEVVLQDCPKLSEVVNSRDRTFKEFLTLLDRAEKFKKWLHAVNPDERLIREYMRDISSRDWLQSTPVKSLRYVFTAAIGMVDPITGLAVGVFDNFLLKKIFGGWRPNHFVQNELSSFVKPRK